MTAPEEAHEGVHLRNILAAKQTLDRVIREALAAGESWSVIGAALDIGGPEAIRGGHQSVIRMTVSGYAFFLLGMVVLISGPQFHHLWWWDWGTAMSVAFLGAVFLSGLRAEIRRKPPGR